MVDQTIHPRRRARRLASWGLAVVALGAAVTFVVSGISLIPPTLALGPCLRDWTSPSSYGTRASPLAALTFAVGDGHVRVCYGRPSARDRVVFGSLVPWGEPWRTGANEPTRLYTDTPITLAGIRLEPGRYSLYTIPAADRWQVIVNRSVLHWGNDLSDAVRDQDVGIGMVPSLTDSNFVETFTIRPEAAGRATHLILEWERTTVSIPLEPWAPRPGDRERLPPGA